LNIQLVAAIINAGTELIGEVIRNRPPPSLNKAPDIMRLLGSEVVPPSSVGVVIDSATQVEPSSSGSGATGDNLSPIQTAIATASINIPDKVSGCPLKASDPDYGPDGKAVSTSCISCSHSHLTTIAGALEEGLRFAREGGIMHPEAIRRLSLADKEVNIMERIDLAPEMVQKSPAEDQELVKYFQPKIRKIRQDIGNITSVEDMEKAAAESSELANEFRLKQMMRYEPSKVVAKVHTNLAAPATTYLTARVNGLSPTEKEAISLKVMAKYPMASREEVSRKIDETWEMIKKAS
jgi:hypothetical protein